MGYFSILSQFGLFLGLSCNILFMSWFSYFEKTLGIGSNFPIKTVLASPSISSALKGTYNAVIS